MPLPQLFPQPRKVIADGGFVSGAGWTLGSVADELATYTVAIEALFDARNLSTDAPRLGVHIASSADLPTEGYRIEVGPAGAAVSASDGLGALHAARTLVDLLDATQGTIPQMTVEDAPEMAHRGVFIESYWGTDLMELSEWIELVDRLAMLKFNTIAISVHGCWDLRHDRDRGEFLFVPLDDFPQLRSPHTYRTWDADKQAEVTLSYVPKMFEENFFGTVTQHAQSVGMSVIPLFGGPGHSSMIPRLVPELSAVDSNGVPTEFGYCVTDPARTGVLRSLFENFIQQHVLPNGITTVAIPGDEFYPIRNVNPDDPTREYTPYCQCEGCSKLSTAQLLITYFTLVGEQLAEHGIRMLNWQDSLQREPGGFDEYEAALETSTAISPIMSWWKYNEPLPQIDADRSWETWVTPSPGIIGSLFAQHFALNIEQMIREGHRVGATGLIAYNMPDPAMHRDYTLLADMSWNYSGSGGGYAFDQRWAERVGGDDPSSTRLAYALGDSIIGSYALMNYFTNHLLPYFSTAPYGTVKFPVDLVRPLSVPTPAFTSTLRQIRDTMRSSIDLLPPTRPISGWPDPHKVWSDEGHRLADHCDLFLRLIQLCRRLHDETPADLEPDLAALEADGVALLNRVASQKVDHQSAYVLREHLGLIGEFRSTVQHLYENPELRPTKAENWHAWLF